MKLTIIPRYWWNKLVRNFRQSQYNFSRQPWANGIVLMVCVVIAMLLANLPFTKGVYHAFLETEFTIHISSPSGLIDVFIPRDMTMEKFINDILMVVFFFTVGLEIKREVLRGELSSLKKALLPVIAAFGGVVVPAIIYTVVNHGTLSASGWGIPTATDIAFAVGILSILGDRVPVSLKVFLTALAIADDLIAILVVAIFYGGTIKLGLLGIALLVILFVTIIKRLGEKRIGFYLAAAIAVWCLFYYSGIHATMTGVVMALLIPMEARYTKAKFHRRAKILYEGLVKAEELQTEESQPEEPFPNRSQRYFLRHLTGLTKKTIPPSYRLEHKLNPVVNYLIMPIFALANAGVEITDPSFFNVFHTDPLLGGAGMGIFLGLVLGKPLGITAASWLAIKCKVGEMPAKASWPMLFSVACLGGIGFTMSIFVDTLSFGGAGIDPAITHHLRDAGKIAVLLGSVCSGLLGSLLINLVSRLKK